MRVDYIDGDEPHGANRYGYGYHGIQLPECPNCGRETRRANLKMPNMGAKSCVCPWCSRSWASRALIRGYQRVSGYFDLGD